MSLKEIHCTLFSTKDELKYVSTISLPIEVRNVTLGKIKSQNGIDCLVLFIESETLYTQHNMIKDRFNTKHLYEEFKPHITLSYDCESINISKINLGEYVEEITFVEEYLQPLNFEVNRRKEVRT